MTTILALDVGHGHIKALLRVSGGPFQRFKFPSLSLAVSSTDLSRNISPGLSVLDVPVDGNTYRVGKDIEMAVPITHERNRDDQYSMTPGYLALVRGALHYAGQHNIDLLVVGLPLTTLNTNAASLEARLSGSHTTPAFDPAAAMAGQTTEVKVKKVVVLAQAVGALIAACEQVPSLARSRVLTLDYGFHTLDVLASMGLSPFPERMGAIPGGVANYIDQLQRSVAGEIRQRRPNLAGDFRVPASIYEHALQGDSPDPQVTLGPGTFSIRTHEQMAVAALQRDLQRAIALIGNATDITSIVLAGGGARLLAAPVRQQFPAIDNVVTLNEAQFAIARGYLAYGDRVVAAAEGKAYA